MAAYVHFNRVIDLKINSQTNPPNLASILGALWLFHSHCD